MPSKLFLEHYRRKAESQDPGVQAGRGPELDPAQVAQIASEVIRLLGLNSAHRLLDVGCANGLFDPIFGSIVSRIVMIEPVVELTRLARTNLQDTQNAEVLQGHARDLPVTSSSFDRVLLLEVLQLIPRREVPEIAAELSRVLEVGGRLLVGSVPDLRYRDAYLERYLDGVREATHLSEFQKQRIIARNMSSTWYGRSELGKHFERAGFECEVVEPFPLTGRPEHRFHVVAKKRAD